MNTMLAQELGQCFFLEELNAEHNSLVTVPASLGSLQQLRELRLKHNRLENLPVEIGGLDTLEVLDCSENDQLAMVPQKLRDDSEMVKFVIRLHYDTLRHITQIKQNYADVKDALQRQEHANLRLRDAIEQCKADKGMIIESLVPDEVADCVSRCPKVGVYISSYCRGDGVWGVATPTRASASAPEPSASRIGGKLRVLWSLTACVAPGRRRKAAYDSIVR